MNRTRQVCMVSLFCLFVWLVGTKPPDIISVASRRPVQRSVMLSWEPFPKRQILDSSRLKEFADDNFKFDKNNGKVSKRIENTVGKGEIAR